MTLYQIDQRIQSLVDPETGELTDYDAFEHLQMERDEKIENTALWVKNLTAEAKAIKEEEDNLKKRRTAMENKATRLKAYLETALAGEAFQSPRCSIGYRKSKALEVEDVDAAAEWLEENGHMDMVVHASPSLDKRAVKELVDNGVSVPGAQIVERRSMQVR